MMLMYSLLHLIFACKRAVYIAFLSRGLEKVQEICISLTVLKLSHSSEKEPFHVLIHALPTLILLLDILIHASPILIH